MTKKEMIADLNALSDFFAERSNAVPVCLVEAVKILENEDFISRKKAYEVLTDFYNHRTKVQHDGLKEALRRVPSAMKE